MNINRVANVYPGQRVITSHGNVAVVAYVRADGRVMVYGRDGMPVPANVTADAWGGESSIDALPLAA